MRPEISGEQALELTTDLCDEIASGDETAIEEAREILRTLANTLRPKQLAWVLHNLITSINAHHNR